MNKPTYQELENQILAQKITIEHLKESKKQYSVIVNSIPKMFKIIELIYDETGKGVDYYYRQTNPAFEIYVGKSREQLIDKRSTRRSEPLEKYWLETYNKVMNTGIPVTYQNNKTNNGHYFEIFAWKIDTKLIAVIFEDITERKLLELKRIADKEKAEESKKLSNDFISNLSHEIRTPMNGILGFTKFLSDPTLTDIKRKHYVSIIQNSGKQLMRTMDDLLEFSKLGTKQVKTIEKEICLNDFLFELFTVFDVKAKENKIPLYLRKGLSDKESTVLIDETKLSNVLGNLLENALKFTKEGFIEFGYKQIDSNLEIYVKDTGIGIKNNHQKSIFRRFSKEEKKSSKNIGGLGLGLWIARENTNLLGGEITLKSKKNIGSTFFVTLPYAPALSSLDNNSSTPNLKEEEEEEEEKEVHKCNILIAEDEEINFLFLEILLKNEVDLHCSIIHAKNGAEAVAICRKNTEIDFVLMDLKMPIMDGFEAIKLIKEFRPELPIVAQTAFSSAEDKERVFAAGFNDFLSKPISQEALSEVINKQKKLKRINSSITFKNSQT
ncbi:response regulator [Flavobacteriaceae bacterium]|nr:response regulator [Flavobacteriaceae bacterium]